jgi:small ligand-binding sensory domain FIST
VIRCAAALAAADSAPDAVVGAVGDVLAAIDDADLLCLFVADPDPRAIADGLRAAAEVAPTVATLGGGVLGVAGSAGSAGAVGRPAGRAQAGAFAVRLDGGSARVFHLETIRTGERLAVLGQPPTGDDSVALLLLADPWTFPVDGFVAGVDQTWPGLPVIGGLADGAAPGDVRLLHGGTVADRGAVGVMLTGPVAVETVSAQGCRPIGPALIVTEAEGSLVRRLAGRPAAEVLAAALAGESPAGVRLGIARESGADEPGFGDFVLRDLVAVVDGGLQVADVVAVGSTVRFQIPDPVAADADLASLLWEVRRRPWVSEIAGALLFSGADRGDADGPRHDAGVVAEQWGCPTIAVSTTAEIAPVAGRNHLHAVSAAVLGLTAAG